MPTVKFKNLKKVENSIRSLFGKFIESKQMKQEIGEFVVKRIQFEARRGKPLNDTRSLPDLSPATQSIRKYLQAYNITHPAFRPKKSQLTLTGQLIDAISHTFTQSGLKIRVMDTLRQPYILNRKLEMGEVETNSSVDRDLRRRGFYMFTARGVEGDERVMKRVRAIVRKFFRRQLRSRK